MASQHTVSPLLLKEAAAKPRLSLEDLPFIDFHAPAMQLYSPKDFLLPTGESLPFTAAVKQSDKTMLVPRPEDCRKLWDDFSMLPNIREHSSKVAVFCYDMALKAQAQGLDINADAAYAAGLLHDLGKSYTIQYGGNHAQVGAAWVMRETRNSIIARAVLFHIHFPWEKEIHHCMTNNDYFIPLAVAYADKRVRHDEYVTLEERFVDLCNRYGINDYSLQKIEASRQQGLLIEEAFSIRLKVPLNAYTPDYGRLVR